MQSSGEIFISQSKYALELIKKFGLENTDSKILISTTCKLDKDEEGIPMDQRLYGSIVGSLLYLTTSRSDILLSVYLCATFQDCPMESH